MIQVKNLSYGFPAKDLYKDISFTIEAGSHCALIGSNGTGKSTLVEMIMDDEKHNYDGKILRAPECRIGYASQFSIRDKNQERTVFEFLSQRFLETQEEIAHVCEEMATGENMDELFEKYQALLDLNEAMDGDNYENNIHKQLYVAGMTDLAETDISQISGGEYKVLQIMREMLLAPNLLILDEPDVFLDFANLGSLCQLINSYKGTLLVITHNRFLLNHCFNKILHLENCDLQEFDGGYGEYRCALLREKLELKLQNIAEQEEIARTEEMVAHFRKRASDMVNPEVGKMVNAKQSQLDRLIARQIKAPFIEVREPQIVLPKVEAEEDELVETDCMGCPFPSVPRSVLKIADYRVEFDEDLLQDVNFEIMEGEKVAIVGANGTGKTTLIRDILKNDKDAVTIDKNIKYACLSQLQGETAESEKTVYQVMQDAGMVSRTDIGQYIEKYCLAKDVLDQQVCKLSGGEQNLLQIALVAASGAELLILDEPTSHLDIHAQVALERAIGEYKGTVLMVTHDFYLVANCADYVLLVEDGTVRRIRARNFRKMVYDKYFDQKYLETDRKRQQLEEDIMMAFKNERYVTVDKLITQLEELM
ncbi:MAG: ABC-F family ATP-binding cassette domain-containing protein [Firmicutes bacterium]|nr:ABC-F family ATP-binding cassette domain-containing protein [Bacillota bacterium]